MTRSAPRRINIWLGTIAGVVLGLLIPAVTRRPVREVLGDVRRHSVLTLEATERLDTGALLYLRDEVRDAVPPLQRFEHVLDFVHPLKIKSLERRKRKVVCHVVKPGPILAAFDPFRKGHAEPPVEHIG